MELCNKNEQTDKQTFKYFFFIFVLNQFIFHVGYGTKCKFNFLCKISQIIHNIFRWFFLKNIGWTICMYRQKAKFMCKPNLVKIIPKGYELKTLIWILKRKSKKLNLQKTQNSIFKDSAENTNQMLTGTYERFYPGWI